MEERIKELMEAQHMNQQVFADFLGISSATLSSIFSKRTKVTLNTVKAIKDKFPTLNYSWLLDGVGPMFQDGKSADANISSTPSSANSGEAFIDFGDTVTEPSGSSSDSGDVTSQPGSSTAAIGQQSAGHGQQANERSGYMNSSAGRPNPNIVTPKIINKITRTVSQILIIYDDQTCETFVPKK